jgi:nucleoside-diphosphate-sugar epimerase/SAM-dependent methyltransferase
MDILLIGHKGYIGAFLYNELVQICGKVSYENEGRSKITGYDEKDGIESRGEYIPAVESYDVVIYLAGLSGRKQCLEQPETRKFTENVVDIMQVSSRMKKGALLIYASTASLYEGYGGTRADENALLYTQLYDEYTYSMYLREQNIRTLSHIDTIGLRFGTVIGLSPTQRTDLVHLAMLRSAVLRGVVSVFGANQHRAILWNRDLLDVFQRILERRGDIRGNHVYNVASLNCTIAKVANEIGCQTGCNVLYKEDTPEIKQVIGFSMNTEKIERAFGITWKGTNPGIIADLKTGLREICVSPDSLLPVIGAICRVCKRESMCRVMDFGNQPNANHYVATPEDTLPEFPLSLDRCSECFHMQLGHTIPPTQMFSDYIYLSGTSSTLRQYFADFAEKTIKHALNLEGGTVLEIACNDGSLLDEYQKRGWKTYGYDAAKNIYEISSKKGHDITVGFWGVDETPEYPPLDMIVAQNVCAHVPDPVAFLSKCRTVMSENTVLYIQTSQCDMVETGQFDTIYHEHLSFFTIHSMWTAAQMAGLAIDGIEKADIHGISYVFRMKIASETDVSQHPLYVHEQRIGLYSDTMYYVYVEKIRGLREWMLKEVSTLSNKGVRLCGYGAAAKGMTILNYIGQIPMEYIVDDSPKKWNLYATNSKYLITSPEKLKETPETVAIVVFAWNFLKEIAEKIRHIRRGMETYLIVPYPKRAIYHLTPSGKTYKLYEEMDTRYTPDSLHHKTILFTHFYNEEALLTQWIRHHAPLFNCAVLIDHNSTDNSRKVIAREAPDSWNVVSSRLSKFCAVETDIEVAGYENSFDNTDWRLALTTTEFLFTLGLRRKATDVFSNREEKRAIQIQSVCVIDDTEESRVSLSAPLLLQKNSFYFSGNREKTKTDQYMNGHYNRFMHTIREFTNPYWLGRHNFKHPAKASNLHIMKCLLSPFPEFFARKLQIRDKVPEHNVKEGWGFQHMVDMKGLMAMYSERKQFPLLKMTNLEGQEAYHHLYMEINNPDDMLLCGIFVNLYGQ